MNVYVQVNVGSIFRQCIYWSLPSYWCVPANWDTKITGLILTGQYQLIADSINLFCLSLSIVLIKSSWEHHTATTLAQENTSKGTFFSVSVIVLVSLVCNTCEMRTVFYTAPPVCTPLRSRWPESYRLYSHVRSRRRGLKCAVLNELLEMESDVGEDFTSALNNALKKVAYQIHTKLIAYFIVL